MENKCYYSTVNSKGFNEKNTVGSRSFNVCFDYL